MPKTHPAAAKLSDAQLVILSAAAQRSEGSLLPFPQSLTAKGSALTKIVETLCKRNLAEERRIVDGAPEWRRDEDNRAYSLFIATGGLLALGLEEGVVTLSEIAPIGTINQQAKYLKSLASTLAVVGKFRSV